MSFYRKYRPQVIEELDNARIRERLTQLREKETKDLPHAYLLTGPRGTGKTTTARIIAKLFNCTSRAKTKRPCGGCEQCQTISAGRNLDVLEIDAASNRGIDEIRALRDAINLAPSGSNYKVYIIDEVHMLTTEAFNALLKTLEEPPAHAVFVLATTDPQKVPVTIGSRCTVLPFARAQSADLGAALSRIAKEEKIDIEDKALALLAIYAEGSFRDAVKLLEQVSFKKGKISEAQISELLLVSNEATRKQFLETVIKKDVKSALAQIAKLINTGGDLKTFLIDCLNDLEKQLVSGVISGQADDNQMLKDLIRHLSRAYVEIKTAPLPVLPLELAVIEFCDSGIVKPASSVDGLKDAKPKRTTGNAGDAGSSGSLSGLLTLEKLIEHWKDFIETLKPYNHSVAGVLRSSRPKSVENGIVTIEAFYRFHQEKLSEVKTREILATVLKKLFGEKTRVEIILGKK